MKSVRIWYTFGMEEALKKYFRGRAIEEMGEILSIDFLTDGNSSNHLNYKVVTSNGTYVARVTKPGDMLSYSNLADEYTILKCVEKFKVGPRALAIDLEHFESPLLIEEFIDGTSFSNLRDADDIIFQRTIDLLVHTSNISIQREQFPFKYTYTTYEINFKVWDYRIKEIATSIGDDHLLVHEFKQIAKEAENILTKREMIIESAPIEFIYNDVHPGNIFWLPQSKEAKFIDWQKVSLGDPTFMIGLFARRFGHIWPSREEFREKTLTEYKRRKNIGHFDELFNARILVSAVSDMIWVVWADVKKGTKIGALSPDENKYYAEAKALMATMS